MKNLIMISAMLVGLSTNANANLIVNGDFEAPALLEGQDYTHVALDCTLPGVNANCIDDSALLDADGRGWTKSTNAPNEFVELRSSDGNQFVELNPSAPGGITQSFEALAGLATISWDHKARTLGGTSEESQGTDFQSFKDYTVFLNGSSIYGPTTTAGDVAGVAFANVMRQNQVLVAGTNTLSFFSNTDVQTNLDLGPHIDNISVIQTSISAVPEPQTYAMFLLGLGLLGLVRSRKSGAV